ncbi:MAG: hypothetical protein L0H25_08780 [Micrococcales bacterium]|nr:hypothetical protein [Micrococcales bacterium]
MIRRHPVKSLTVALVVLVAGLVLAWFARPTYSVAPTVSPRPGESLVVVGVEGLSWSDVSAAGTPLLWGLLRDGATATVSVKAMGAVTCPTDGWATLGAGEAAGTQSVATQGTQAAGTGCGGLPPVSGDATSGYRVTGFEAIARASRAGPHHALLGLLGDSLAKVRTCVQAVGPGAALAAATSDDRVAHYAPFEATRLRHDLARCPVALVDIGALTVGQGTPADPATEASEAAGIAQVAEVAGVAQAAAVERRLARVLGAAPAGADVIVVGVSDLPADPAMGGGMQEGLRLLAATGPHYAPGMLASASTRLDGVAQLSDVTATILARGGARPVESIGGRALTVRPSASSSEASAEAKLTALTDLESRTEAMRRVVTPFLVIWLVGAALLLLALAMVWQRAQQQAQRQARPWQTRLTRSRMVRLAGVVAALTAAMPAATFLANLVPWWRWSSTTWALVALLIGVVMIISAGLAAISLRGPWAGSALGPMAALAGITAGVIGVDVMSGSHLQTASVFGLQPLIGGRFYGMGNVAFALYAPAVLLLIAALAHALLRREAPAAALVSASVIGACALAVDALPAWGADFGGPIALVPALGLLLLAIAGVRPSLGSVAAIVVAAALLVGGVSYLDWRRPPGQRSHPGRFVQTLLDGDAWEVVRRKLMQNVELLVAKPALLVVVLAVLALVAVVLIRPGAFGTAPFARLVAHAPLLRHGLLAVVVLAVIGFVTNDSGAAIPPVVLIITVPLVMVAAVCLDLVARARQR